MPVQTQNSSFAKKMAGRVTAAHMEHKDKPIDAGNQRLPSGIKNGIAKLSALYTKEYDNDNMGPGTKGQTFFRASAIVMSPEVFNGVTVAGQVTQVIISLCDLPAKGQRKAKSFSENWFEFQNLFKLLGIAPPNETQQTDPTGQRTEAYYFAAMKSLIDPTRPVYISFSTRGWTPPATPQSPKPTEMVFEDWHGLAEFSAQHDPVAGMAPAPGAGYSGGGAQPEPMSPPPTALNPTPTAAPAAPFNEFASGMPDQADVIAALVETAMNDPEGATEDGANASARLEEIAWGLGWTKEQTAAGADWAAVGDMALNPPNNQPPVVTTQAAAPATAPTGVVVGGKHRFAKRTKDGAKLKDNKGVEFPAQDVEVVSVDVATKTCTVKSAKDGKTVVDIRTKAPVAVKFEWLE